MLALASERKATAEVRHYEVKTLPGAPSGVSAILRERRTPGKQEVTWKYRGGEEFSSSDDTPLLRPIRQESKRKDEMDISLLADGKVKRSFSRSGSSKASFAEAVPVELSATQKGCDSTVLRRESKDGRYKVEEWNLANGEKFVELSWNADDTSSKLATFQSLVARLVATGTRPVDRSKTEIGTQCSAV